MSLRSSAGPATGADADAELLADDVREPRLAEPGRAGEQDVVERLAARLRGVERDRELLLHALLADEVVEPARPQRLLELSSSLVVVGRPRVRNSRRVMPPAAARAGRCSSGGRSGSTSASARSASSSE